MTKSNGTEKTTVTKAKRSRVSPSDIPRYSLREALTIAQAITDNFAGQPTSPLQVAMSLNKSPTSSGWRYLSGAATGYGLTSGSYNAEKIVCKN